MLSDFDYLKKIIEDQQNTFQEDISVAQLENMCSKLKTTLIQYSYDLPPLVSFQRYLDRITDYGDLIYIIGLIRLCWMYAHPILFFEQVAKPSERLFDMMSSYGSFHKPIQNIEFDNNDHLNGLAIEYFNNWVQKSSSRVVLPSSNGKHNYSHIETYDKYFGGLYTILDKVCKRKQFSIVTLSNQFLINGYLPFELERDKIEAVFDLAVKRHYLAQNDMVAFYALFPNTYNAITEPLVWNDNDTKCKSPSIASLYVFINTLFEYSIRDNGKSDDEKKELEDTMSNVIMRYFVKADGKGIEREALRKSKLGIGSGSLQTLRSEIEEAIR